MREGIEVTLLPHFEPLASQNPFKEKLPFLLEHQLETFNSIKDNDIVFNLSTTGTGKTLSALLGLLNFPENNILIIAPTNALVSQHKRDAQVFVEKFSLPHLVEEINAEELNKIEMSHVKRKGEKLYRILSNPVFYLEDRPGQKKPFILITNPDIFYYSIFYLFNPLDKRNIAQEFMTVFDYIVIDELHYYNAKQFANLLYFIILSHKFGFFEKRERKIVVLTATPDSQFIQYIDELKKLRIRVKEIDSSVFSDNHSTQVLSELKLTLFPLRSPSEFPNIINSFIDSMKLKIKKEKKDGLIISNSLRNINIIAKNLNSTPLKNEYARITGPIPKLEREEASLKPLVLATPTVDIGYNFVGRMKDRQNIDFGYFDARYVDQFWQRLGRIGRVLGKPIQDKLSVAYAFIPEEAYILLKQNTFSPTYKRDEFKETVENLLGQNGFMQKNLNQEYISHFSLLEVMLPIKNILDTVSGNLKSFIEETFETIKAVYSPGSQKKFWSLLNEIKGYQEVEKALNELEMASLKLDSIESIRLLREKYGRNSDMARKFIEDGDQEIKKEFISFLRNKIAKYDAMFKFRDSGAETSVAAYDPQGLISASRGFVILDLIHLVRNYEFEPFKDKKDAFMKTGIDPSEAQLYVSLKDMFPQPLVVRLAYTLPEHMTFQDFDREFVGNFVSLNNMEIVGYKKDFGGEDSVPLRKAVRRGIYEKFITGIILPNNFQPALINKCKNEELYPSELEVTSEGKTKTYLFIMGIEAHEFSSKYGWSIKKLNLPAFIA